MKTGTLIAAMAIVFVLSAPCFGKIWHVNNNSGITTDFTTPQEAHDSASVADGDTLYIYGSGISYGDLTLTREIHIVGPGYFLNINPETQTIPSMAELVMVYCNAGSDGSSVQGMKAQHIQVVADNITVARNYILGTNNTVSTLTIAAGADNIIVMQNYMDHINKIETTLHIGGTNIFVSNNIIASTHTVYPSDPSYAIYMNTDASAVIKNNVFHNPHNVTSTFLILYNSSVHNNIVTDGPVKGANNTFTHNIADANQFGTENGNQANVNMADVFVDSGSTDGKWQLKAGSIALNAGDDGTDCGAFGGVSPYVLSGLPPVPAIHHYSAPNIGSNMTGLPFKIKVKAHD